MSEQPELIPTEADEIAATPKPAFLSRKTLDYLQRVGTLIESDDAYYESDKAGKPQQIDWQIATASRIQQTSLTNAEYRVLGYLAWRHNGKTGKCCPAIRTIADETENSTSTVQTALKGLIEKGLLVRESGNARSPNRYRLTADSVWRKSPHSVAISATEQCTMNNKGSGGPEPAQSALFDDGEPALKAGKPTELFSHLLPLAIRADTEAMLALGRYAEHRRERRSPLTIQSVKAICREVKGWTAAQVAEACQRSIANGWQGLFLPARADGRKSHAETPEKRAEKYKNLTNENAL